MTSSSPGFVYVLEHPEGMIAIDTGMSTSGWPTPGPVKRLAPWAKPGQSSDAEIGPQMRTHGLPPEDVRTVLLTHLDPDHRGGIEHFRKATFLVHRREHKFAHTRMARFRSRPQDWPGRFEPTAYDLEAEPFGPFAKSKVLTERGDVRAVPLPGHTPGQVGIVMETDAAPLFFAADHTMSKDWFEENHLGADRLPNVGLAAPKAYADTDRRVQRFMDETSAVLLPAHDPGAPRRLAEALRRGR